MKESGKARFGISLCDSNSSAPRSAFLGPDPANFPERDFGPLDVLPYFPDLRRLSSAQSIWQLSGTVLPTLLRTAGLWHSHIIDYLWLDCG